MSRSELYFFHIYPHKCMGLYPSKRVELFLQMQDGMHSGNGPLQGKKEECFFTCSWPSYPASHRSHPRNTYTLLFCRSLMLLDKLALPPSPQFPCSLLNPFGCYFCFLSPLLYFFSHRHSFLLPSPLLSLSPPIDSSFVSTT